MINRHFFREHGQVIRTRRGDGLANALFTLGAVAVLLALLAWGHARDQGLAEQGAFDAGLAVGQFDMEQVVGDAYLQGRADAAAELGQPAQPCQAPRPAAARPAGGLL